MTVRIAIPEPTSLDIEYNQRSLQPYLGALEACGAEPVVVPLGSSQQDVARMIATVQGFLLPGSRYDVDPRTYGEESIPECDDPDPARRAVDELIFQDAFNLWKPVLAICYGVQALNVWRNGCLIQDIESQLKSPVDHQPGRGVQMAHPVRVAPGSRLAAMISPDEASDPMVNSSHHQAIREAGDNLVVSAVSPADGVIEAVELNSEEHYVVGVQWHPERTFATSALSRATFATFIAAARTWQPRRVEVSVARG